MDGKVKSTGTYSRRLPNDGHCFSIREQVSRGLYTLSEQLFRLPSNYLNRLLLNYILRH
jgi:hypothetical protein